MQIVIDTNVIVSFLTDRNLQQQQQAAELFSDAAAGKHRLLLPQAVLLEMVYVLENLYQVSSADCAVYLSRLVEMPGVLAVHEVSWGEVLAWWPKPIGSLGDALVAATSKAVDAEAVATFDQNLKKRFTRLGVQSFW